MFPTEQYQQAEIKLQGGDLLALFTDGVTEVQNSEGEEFGEERLQQLLMDQSLTAAELRNNVMSAVKEFGSGTFDDDVTLLLIRANA